MLSWLVILEIPFSFELVEDCFLAVFFNDPSHLVADRYLVLRLDRNIVEAPYCCLCRSQTVQQCSTIPRNMGKHFRILFVYFCFYWIYIYIYISWLLFVVTYMFNLFVNVCVSIEENVSIILEIINLCFNCSSS